MEPPLPSFENPSYGYWGSYIRKVDSKYRIYYSIVVTNPIVDTNTNNSWTERAFIGVGQLP